MNISDKRQLLKRRWKDPEWRKKWTETMSGPNNPLFGKKPSEERMRAVVAACMRRKGETRSEETKRKISDAHKRRRQQKQDP